MSIVFGPIICNRMKTWMCHLLKWLRNVCVCSVFVLVVCDCACVRTNCVNRREKTHSHFNIQDLLVAVAVEIASVDSLMEQWFACWAPSMSLMHTKFNYIENNLHNRPSRATHTQPISQYADYIVVNRKMCCDWYSCRLKSENRKKNQMKLMNYPLHSQPGKWHFNNIFLSFETEKLNLLLIFIDIDDCDGLHSSTKLISKTHLKLYSNWHFASICNTCACMRLKLHYCKWQTPERTNWTSVAAMHAIQFTAHTSTD